MRYVLVLSAPANDCTRHMNTSEAIRVCTGSFHLARRPGPGLDAGILYCSSIQPCCPRVQGLRISHSVPRLIHLLFAGKGELKCPYRNKVLEAQRELQQQQLNMLDQQLKLLEEFEQILTDEQRQKLWQMNWSQVPEPCHHKLHM